MGETERLYAETRKIQAETGLLLAQQNNLEVKELISKLNKPKNKARRNPWPTLNAFAGGVIGSIIAFVAWYFITKR